MEGCVEPNLRTPMLAGPDVGDLAKVRSSEGPGIVPTEDAVLHLASQRAPRSGGEDVTTGGIRFSILTRII